MDDAKHYHVISNDPGCMPDSHDIYCEFQWAVDAARELARNFYGEGQTACVRATVDWEREYADFGIRPIGTEPGRVTHVIEVTNCTSPLCEFEFA